MKKILISAMLVAGACVLATPASAQTFCDSANGCRTMAPSANERREGYNGGYESDRYTDNGGYDNRRTVVPILDRSRRPRDGEVIVAPDCSSGWWDKKGRRMVPISPPPKGGCERGIILTRDALVTQ